MDHQLQLEERCTSAERPVATHILALMIRGLFASMKFRYAHFPTKSLTGDELFETVQEGIEPQLMGHPQTESFFICTPYLKSIHVRKQEITIELKIIKKLLEKNKEAIREIEGGVEKQKNYSSSQTCPLGSRQMLLNIIFYLTSTFFLMFPIS